jgi:hypothetical protein
MAAPRVLALLLLALSLAAPAWIQADTVGTRGGSLSAEPCFLIPSGGFGRAFHPTLGYNLDFDIGLSRRFSLEFGGGWYETKHLQNPDLRLMLTPGWLGLKVKEQWLPDVEFYWQTLAAGYYQKLYYVKSATGQEENLDGGLILGTGVDWWLRRWLLVGLTVRYNLMIESREVFPFTQIGMRLGLRS